jgi:phosphoribosylformylglycinamidine synthase
VSRFHLEIRVTPRPGLLDPQGEAVRQALTSLGYPGIHQVRVGKLLRVEVEADSADEARAQGEAMCRKLLANPITEDFLVELGSAELGATDLGANELGANELGATELGATE